ncbi:MAG TPA: hypothetical protein PLL20_06380 [Phycisphaerae bacterium]|nr:hypothetical protein [Phycisphaerae bacterium]
MQTPPKPVRALWIPWPLAVVLVPLFWLLPKRMGPHFAAVRWPGVIVAHLVWVVYGLGCMTVAYWTPMFGWAAYLTGRTSGHETEALWPDPTISQIARAPMAVLGTLLAGNPEFGVNGWVGGGADLAIGLAMAVAVEAGLILLACLLMPYATAGERGQLLFSRSVKLTLWSTTSLPVLGIAFQAIELLDYTREQLDELWAGAIGLYVLWFVWIWLRSGLRYAGPTEGPAWKPRRPLCETCGYALTGLKSTDNCPECGAAIAYSLPERRRPTSWAAAHRLASRPRAFLRTCWASLRTDFYRRTTVRTDYPAARRFAIWMCLASLPLVVPFGIIEVLLWRPDYALRHLGKAAVAATAIPVGILLFLSLLVLLGRLSGHRSLRTPATVVFYWSAWAVPILLAVDASMLIVYVLKERFQWNMATYHYSWAGTIAHYASGAAICALPAVVFLFAAIRLVRALRQTRFANA